MLKYLLLLSFPLVAQVTSVPTAQYSNARTGANTNEVILTPSNVVSGQFGLLGHYAVDGAVYSQPLYVSDVTISGKLHNIVVIVTMNDSIYAFDADQSGGSPLWSNLAFDTTNTSIPGQQLNFELFYGAQVGCESTPVIDTAAQIIYAVCTNATPAWVLRSFSLTTGAILNSVTLSATVTGTGDGGSTVTFNGTYHNQRAPLALANGNVYIAFAGYDDMTWHGWVFAYATSGLTQTAVFCATPNGQGAGIWESGGGIAVDGSGNIYVVTGNGTYDGAASGDYGQSVVKLNAELVVQDWFTPSNNATTSTEDADLSSGRQVLIPGTTLLTLGSKDFRAWVIDTTNMGHLQGSGQAPQVFTIVSGTVGQGSGNYGGMFMNGVGYFPIVTGSVYAFSFSGSTYNTTSTGNTSATFPFPGAVLTGSSNGANTQIIWMVGGAASAFSNAVQATLYAFNTSFSQLYSSTGSDAPGNVTKFAAPLVVNGRVYLPSVSNAVYIYGLKKGPGLALP